jgi:hypothetical protein
MLCLYNVQIYTMYKSTQCTIHNVMFIQCTNPQCTNLHNVQSTQCTNLHNVQSTMYQTTMYKLQCTYHNVHITMYKLQSFNVGTKK